MPLNLFYKALRMGEGRKLKNLAKKAEAVGAWEKEISQLTDSQLKSKTEEFKKRLRESETLDDILPEAFAVAREVGKRTLSMRHFDVQVMGGVALYEGKVIEMATGEGKTLVATLPAYLIGLEGKGVHIVTVNDYLAKRDVQWMGPIYHSLGISVAVLQHETPGQVATAYLYDPIYGQEDESLKYLRPVPRKEAYLADVVYGTNSEFGFDYLRDNMVTSLEDRVQRGHYYAIVDEVDSILIDEARTPLIISGVASREAVPVFKKVDKVVSALRGITMPKEETGIPKEERDRLKEEREQKYDYVANEAERAAYLTHQGRKKVAQMIGTEADALFGEEETDEDREDQWAADPQIVELRHIIDQVVVAHSLYEKDRDYVVKDGEVIIVDEFTGRLMFGRRYSDQLHQAIEAKEKVTVQEKSQTLATITLQNYFRMYEKLAGMTGTAAPSADEFMHTYKLDTVIIPTNRPLVRDNMPDAVYKTGEAKFKAVIEDIVERQKKGQPVLVGTISIEKSERLGKMLKRRGVPHEVLNAKQHEREAHIIAQAGRKEAVTIATNMAGRGVDILLGGNPEEMADEFLHRKSISVLEATEEQRKEVIDEANEICQKENKEVINVGGLHVLGTERHEARRIDLQLRGRSGRQGDPGSSQFYLSLEDDLMRLFGSSRVGTVMERLKVPDDMPIEHALVTKSIKTAQRQVESQNFEIRKQVLEYDDVMNKQREVIYEQRYKCLAGDDLHEQALDIFEDIIRKTVPSFIDAHGHPEDWDLDGLFAYMHQLFPLNWGKDEVDTKATTAEELTQRLLESVNGVYKKKEEEIGLDTLKELERQIMLQVIDNKWLRHLEDMDALREGIGLRAIAQKDPLVEYKNEGFAMFSTMIEEIKEDFMRYIQHVQVAREQPQAEVRVVEGGSAAEAFTTQARAQGFGAEAAPSEPSKPEPVRSKKVGRNDPCPCGSGKKYKKCCGA